MGIKVSLITLSGVPIETTLVGSRAVIGRSVNCDVVVPDTSLSRRHCEIEINSGNFYVTDLGSSNGVSIDGSRIQPNVKTSFGSFQQLHLGPLECTIEEAVSEDKLSFPTTDNSKTFRPEATVTRRLNRDELKQLKTKTKPKTPKKKNKSNLNLPWLTPGLILAASVFYFLNNEAQIQQQDRTPQAEAVPKPVEAVKKIQEQDSFKTDAYYIELKSQATCTGFENYCSRLDLKQEISEGMIKEEQSIYLYISPTQMLENEIFVKIKNDKLAMDIAAFKKIIPSKLIDDYFLEHYSQLHVLILGPNGKIVRAYRLHPSKFNAATFPRLEFLSMLSATISNGDSTTFATELEKYFSKKEIADQ